MDVSKAIDKHLGKKREVIGKSTNGASSGSVAMNHGRSESFGSADGDSRTFNITAPATDAAAQWDGWGTCLKPAWEPIIVARKPLDGTVANNVLTWGTGALNIDGCRVPIEHGDDVFAKNPHTRSKGKDSGIYGAYGAAESNWSGAKGRFPANLVHDGSQMVLDLFPDTGKSSGGGGSGKCAASGDVYGQYAPKDYPQNVGMGDTGSAARFFYCAKASKKERGEGNNHPTVKPIALMRWLVTLVTPQGGGGA